MYKLAPALLALSTLFASVAPHAAHAQTLPALTVPTISISNAVVMEGDSGTSTLSFVVTVQGSLANPVQAQFATVDGTATSTVAAVFPGPDLVPDAGVLSFSPGGPTTQHVDVVVNADVADESDEQLFVDLVSVSGAQPTRSRGTGTIRNDDRNKIVLADTDLIEGTGPRRSARLTVALSKPDSLVVSVDVDTQNGTATAGADYQAVSTTLVFQPGETSKSFAMPLVADAIVEADEVFFVRFSNHVNIGSENDGVHFQAAITVLNDD